MDMHLAPTEDNLKLHTNVFIKTDDAIFVLINVFQCFLK
jgi:hypothetical protein